MSYYRGDFWGKLAKGARRLGKNIGRVAQQVAPIASVLLPTVGAATLVGRGIAASRRIKKAGRDARALAGMIGTPTQQLAQTITTSAPAARAEERGYRRATTYRASSGRGATRQEASMAQPEHVLWSAGGSRTDASGWPLIPDDTAVHRRRAAYRRRKATKRRTTTTRRRGRRRTRRRS